MQLFNQPIMWQQQSTHIVYTELWTEIYKVMHAETPHGWRSTLYNRGEQKSISLLHAESWSVSADRHSGFARVWLNECYICYMPHVRAGYRPYAVINRNKVYKSHRINEYKSFYIIMLLFLMMGHLFKPCFSIPIWFPQC